MSRSLAARLEAADQDTPRGSSGGPRRPPSRRDDDPDRNWKLLLAALCGLIVVLGGYQMMGSFAPAETRLGTKLYDVKEPADGPLTFSMFDTPPLKEVGNCVAVRAGDEYFVVRAGENAVTAFRTKTKNGEMIRWDQKRGRFVYAKNDKQEFTIYGGPVDPSSVDALIPVLISLSNDKLQITR